MKVQKIKWKKEKNKEKKLDDRKKKHIQIYNGKKMYIKLRAT